MERRPEFARIRSALAASINFRALAPEDLDSLASLGTVRELRDRGLAVRRGSRQEGLWIIMSGGLRLSAVTSRGREFVYAMLGPGSYYGLGSMLRGRGTPTDVHAVGRTAVAVLDYAKLLALLDERPRLWRHVATLLNHRLTIAMEILRDISAVPIRQRVVRRLLGLAMSNGHDVAGVQPIALRLTQADLGRMLGTGRSRINGTLKRLEKDGMIKVGYRTISLLDLGELRAVAGPEVFSF